MKAKRLYALKDGELYGVYDAIIQAVYELHISYASIKKSVMTGSYIKGYKFCRPCEVTRKQA